MRTMYDSTSIADIPIAAQLVGYYVDGIYAVSEAVVRARFPAAVLVGISAVGTNAGVAGDVEPGCMTPEQAVLWVKMRRAAGVDPTVYVNQGEWARVRQLMQAAGITEPHYWIADWRNYPDPTIPPDAIARQYGGSAQTQQHYDISAVADKWPGVDHMTATQNLTLNVLAWRFLYFLGGSIPAAGTTHDDLGNDVSTYAVPGAPTLPELLQAVKSGAPLDEAALLAAIKGLGWNLTLRAA